MRGLRDDQCPRCEIRLLRPPDRSFHTHSKARSRAVCNRHSASLWPLKNQGSLCSANLPAIAATSSHVSLSIRAIVHVLILPLTLLIEMDMPLCPLWQIPFAVAVAVAVEPISSVLCVSPSLRHCVSAVDAVSYSLARSRFSSSTFSRISSSLMSGVQDGSPVAVA